MDKSSRLELKVGLFVFLALVLLAVLLVQFSKGTSLFRSTYTLKLHTRDVGGLKRQSNVLLAGVQVGTVKDIVLAPDGKSVTIFLNLYRDNPVYTNSMFVIEQAGFLGDQYVSIIPSTNVVAMTDAAKFSDGADVDCQPPFNLQEVARAAGGFIQRIDETAKKLDGAMTDLQRQVLNAETLANFGVAITNMRNFTEQALGAVQEIHTLVTTNGTQVSTAVSNLVQFSDQLTHLANSAQEVLATNGSNLTAATKNLEDLSVTAKQLAADLQAGKGLAGTLLQNPELATNVQSLAANLSLFSSNLNQRGLWGILWSHKTPAPNTNNLNNRPARSRP